MKLLEKVAKIRRLRTLQARLSKVRLHYYDYADQGKSDKYHRLIKIIRRKCKAIQSELGTTFMSRQTR